MIRELLEELEAILEGTNLRGSTPARAAYRASHLASRKAAGHARQRAGSNAGFRDGGLSRSAQRRRNPGAAAKNMRHERRLKKPAYRAASKLRRMQHTQSAQTKRVSTAQRKHRARNVGKAWGPSSGKSKAGSWRTK